MVRQEGMCDIEVSMSRARRRGSMRAVPPPPATRTPMGHCPSLTFVLYFVSSHEEHRTFLAMPQAFSRHLFLRIASAFRSCVLFE